MGDDRSTDERLADIESKLLTREKVEEIAAAAALNVLEVFKPEVRKATQAADEVERALEPHQFARKVAASFADRACARSLDKLLVQVLQDEIGNAVEEKLPEAFDAVMQQPEVAAKLQGGAEAAEQALGKIDETSRQLAQRLDKIEQEAVPKIVDRELEKKLVSDTMKQLVVEVARQAVKEIVNMPEFKSALEDKFKVMIKYITEDVIPKIVRKHMGA